MGVLYGARSSNKRRCNVVIDLLSEEEVAELSSIVDSMDLHEYNYPDGHVKWPDSQYASRVPELQKLYEDFPIRSGLYLGPVELPFLSVRVYEHGGFLGTHVDPNNISVAVVYLTDSMSTVIEGQEAISMKAGQAHFYNGTTPHWVDPVGEARRVVICMMYREVS